MWTARKKRARARFLLTAACLFTFLIPAGAWAQMHHHSDLDFERLQDKAQTLQDDIIAINKHFEADDPQIVHDKERLDKMEGMAEVVSFFFGSGVLFALATIVQKKKGSA